MTIQEKREAARRELEEKRLQAAADLEQKKKQASQSLQEKKNKAASDLKERRDAYEFKPNSNAMKEADEWVDEKTSDIHCTFSKQAEEKRRGY